MVSQEHSKLVQSMAAQQWPQEGDERLPEGRSETSHKPKQFTGRADSSGASLPSLHGALPV